MSYSKFKKEALEHKESGAISEKICDLLIGFYHSFSGALPETESMETYDSLFSDYLAAVKEQFQNPHHFAHYHERVRTPFDYYAFGLNFLRPMVDFTHSTFEGDIPLKQIEKQLEAGDNVIFLANHQIEADPQAISLLLEERSPQLGEEMIFVAGERVLTDPLAIPFSLGRNLLCIYSKRYIDNPPEDKMRKQLHNSKTMQIMSDLLKEGGKAIYVAPSGGRDRMNQDGEIQIAPFDPQSIEMFLLMAKKSGKKTHFYPLTLATYAVLPPPETIQVELGEARSTKRSPIHMCIGEEIDMQHFPGSDGQNKHVKRKARADYIYNLVCKTYDLITRRKS